MRWKARYKERGGRLGYRKEKWEGNGDVKRKEGGDAMGDGQQNAEVEALCWLVVGVVHPDNI